MEKKEIYKDYILKCVCPLALVLILYYGCERPVGEELVALAIIVGLPIGISKLKRWRFSVFSSNIAEAFALWVIVYVLVGGFIGAGYIVYKVIYGVAYMPVIIYRLVTYKEKEIILYNETESI